MKITKIQLKRIILEASLLNENEAQLSVYEKFNNMTDQNRFDMIESKA